MAKYKFNIPTSNNGSISIELLDGNALFVLGANGVGKSTLMHIFFNNYQAQSKRILAHRRTWFEHNAMDMTASQKKQTEQNMKHSDSQATSRWMDSYSQARSSISIFDLINSENIRARQIATAVDSGKIDSAKELSSIQAPLKSINELLAISNIPIAISLEKDEQLMASKSGSTPYSIAELSDGERNALLICADVLTADSGFLIIIDEPERHLHRSIISPLLSSLFQKRRDCVFVISTHDVSLPIDHPEAKILLLRGCQWQGRNIKDWDADLITEADKITSEVKQDILGSKRNILFVEGEAQSLDKQIYQILYPKISVISQGGCTQVERAVDGIKQTQNLHWINAYGLIDADDRTSKQLEELLSKGIAALKCYSVESLYYDLEIVKKVAERYSTIVGIDAAKLYDKATGDIIKNVAAHRDRLCARLAEKRVRNLLTTNLPTHKDIATKTPYEKKLDIKALVENEEQTFDKMIAEKNITGLIERYPLRETQVLSQIAQGLGLSRDTFEKAVRKLLIDDEGSRKHLKSRLTSLTKLMGE